MRFAAHCMCGDVRATTVPANPALIRAWLVKVKGGLAKPADRPPRDHYPGARVAARRRKRDGHELPSATPGTTKRAGTARTGRHCASPVRRHGE